jgi:glycogen debranching enzyme
MSTLCRAAALSVVLLLGLPSTTSGATQEAPFHFEVKEGQNLNCFLRDGKSAAHLVLRSGQDPRILVAFPAGNSGVGLWFQRQEAPAEWVVDSLPEATDARDSAGRPLYGIVFETSIATKSLAPKQAVLSSVRVLRDYQTSGTVPDEVVVRPAASGNTVAWSRNRLDGAPGYRLALEVIDGTLRADGQISAGADGRIKLRVTALTGDVPLTPLSGTALLNGKENQDERARDTLTFLSYKEKFLAGSWRFDTYFGRDTLMSVRLLMPVLAPDAIEAGLRAVLARLASDGEVAHEESIGEFAVLSHKRQDGTLSDTPIFDYGMIDGNYLLAPVIAAYLLDNPEGKNRASGYLRDDVAAYGGTRISAGRALMRNLRLVAASAANFAADPRYDNLISLKPGRTTGQWRDSDDGIGGGRYPYDVNAVLVPAALDATTRLLESGLLDPFLAPGDRKLLSRAAADAKIWRKLAPSLFNMTFDNESARAAVDSYARQIGVPAEDALTSLGGNTVSFHAISLAASGKPVPIVNSDEALELLFATPAPATLDRDVRSVIRPFPLGLLTDAGMVVANPVFADDGIKAHFTNHAYHGTVVWSWQQALFASGLERQLGRTDLRKPVKEHLLTAQQTLWRAIRATQSVRSSELWSWRFEGGRYRIVPFGSSGTDADESNAAQLWSSVYLAVKTPSSPRLIENYPDSAQAGPLAVLARYSDVVIHDEMTFKLNRESCLDPTQERQ